MKGYAAEEIVGGVLSRYFRIWQNIPDGVEIAGIVVVTPQHNGYRYVCTDANLDNVVAFNLAWLEAVRQQTGDMIVRD